MKFVTLLFVSAFWVAPASAQLSADYTAELVVSTANSGFSDLREPVLDGSGTLFFIGVEGQGKGGNGTLVIGREDATLHTPTELGYTSPFSFLRLDAAGVERLAFGAFNSEGGELVLSDQGQPISIVLSLGRGGAAYDIPQGTEPSVSASGTILFSARKRCMDGTDQNVVAALGPNMTGGELLDGCADPSYRSSNIRTAISPSGRYAAVSVVPFDVMEAKRVLLIDRQGGSAGQGSSVTELGNSDVDPSLMGLSQFRSIAVNDQGTVAVAGRFSVAPVSRVMVAQVGASLSPVADAAMLSPSASIEALGITGAGDIVFFGNDFANNLGLLHYAASTGAVQLLFRRGDTVAGESVNLLEWVRGGVNNAGQIAVVLANASGRHIARLDPLSLPMPADVTVTLEGPSTAQVNTPVTYRAAVFNAGPSDAEGVELELELPSSLNVTTPPSGCVPAPMSNDKLLCAVGALEVNAMVSFELEAVSPTVGTVSVTVRATTMSEDPFPMSNEVTIETSFEAPPPPPPPVDCLTLPMTISSEVVPEGVQMTLELTNDSDVAATGILVLLSGNTEPNPDPNAEMDGNYDADLNWELPGPIEPGQTVRLVETYTRSGHAELIAEVTAADQTLCAASEASLLVPHFGFLVELSADEPPCEDSNREVTITAVVRARADMPEGARLLIRATGDTGNTTSIPLESAQGCAAADGCPIPALARDEAYRVELRLTDSGCQGASVTAELRYPEGARGLPASATLNIRGENTEQMQGCVCVSRPGRSSLGLLVLLLLCGRLRRSSRAV